MVIFLLREIGFLLNPLNLIWFNYHTIRPGCLADLYIHVDDFVSAYPKIVFTNTHCKVNSTKGGWFN